MAEASPALDELVLRDETNGWRLLFHRDEQRRFSVVTASHDGRRRVNRLAKPYERLAEDLSKLPVDALSMVRFGRCRGLSNQGREALLEALARQTKLEKVKLPR